MSVPRRISDAISEVDVEGCWASVMHILRNEDQPYPDSEPQALHDVAMNLSGLSEQALTYAIKVLWGNDEDIWTDFPGCPREDWRQEVANEDTQLGYWQWVFHKLQSQEVR